MILNEICGKLVIYIIMKKILLLISLTLFLVLPISALAMTEEGSSVKVESGEALNYNLLKIANTIEINGEVNGDVIVAGGTLEINGPVRGDVLAVANLVKINSEIDGDVRIVANQAEINGQIFKNFNVFANEVRVNDKAQIGGDLTAWGGKITLLGKISGDVDGGGKNVNLGGEVGGHVNLKIESDGDFKLADNVNIGGDLFYQAAKQTEIPQTSQIKGKVNYLIIKEEPINNFLNLAYWFGKIISFFGLLLVAVIISLLWPDKLKKFSRLVMENLTSNLLRGIILLLVVPLIIIGLLLSVIGIPLAIIILAFYLLIIYLSKIVLAVWLGERFFSGIKSAVVSLALGLLIIVVAISLPYVGRLLNLIIICLVLGGLGRNFRELLKINQN